MTLAEIQQLLHELNYEYKTKGPNIDSKLTYLRDALDSSNLTVIKMWQGDPAHSCRGGIATRRSAHLLAVLLSC